MIYKFKNFSYNLNYILTPLDIELALNKFNNEELLNIDAKLKFCILFKIQTIDGDWRNISYLQIADKTNINDLINIFNIFWSYKSDNYKSLVVSKLVFRYRFVELKIAPSKSILKYPIEFEKTDELLPHGNTNLPNNRLFESWGDEIIINDDNTYTVNKNNHSFLIKELNNEYNISLFYRDKEILKFKDKYDTSSKSDNTFVRTMDNSELHFYNGKCEFIKEYIKSSYIKGKLTDISIKNNIITLDLETRNINNVMHVISASIYDGSIIKSFYLTDFNNSDELIKQVILQLLQRKYNGYRVYIHNFSRFDAAFMLRILANMDNCVIKRCIKRDSKIIDIKLNYNLTGKRKYSIYFRDSLLILPSNLRELGNNFAVETKKSIYPYKFVNNIEISLDYVGKVPSYDNFIVKQSLKDKNGITKEEYINYSKEFKNNAWSLRKETIKYCENDVISLYLIIKEFQKRIFRLFEADINKYPTLSSLAFAIYRMKYLKNYKIPNITGELYRNIKKSYTGGSVDVYKPIGKNLRRYDVNSLYPAVMSEFPSPVGKITKFKGNILKYETNPFGFFFVNIKAPANLDIPILQTRIKTKNSGIRTLSPLGEWSGWYFSEEIFNAINNGYEIKIIWGYLFEKEYIFKDFVNDLYGIKKKSVKNTSDYIISKLLLNSLYGRFGMTPDKECHEVIKGSYEIGKFITNSKITVKDSLELDNNIELISYVKNIEDEENSTFGNINVSIASSITSYARIKMSEIKSNYANNIYYSDTDSIDLDIKLPDKYISNNLGDYKHEKTFKNIVYIAPKVYAAITEDNKEYVVIKGYKNENVSYNEIANIINKDDKLELKQEKWYVDLSAGRIITKEETYTLMATENKRRLVYENNKLVKTMPYIIKNDKLIN